MRKWREYFDDLLNFRNNRKRKVSRLGGERSGKWEKESENLTISMRKKV